MPKRTSNPEYRRRRAEVLEGNPLCHWCKKAPATEADHVIPHDLVGDDTPIVASCKPCNAQRGAIYLAQKKAHVQHQRNEALGLQDGNKTPKPKNPENFLKNMIKLKDILLEGGNLFADAVGIKQSEVMPTVKKIETDILKPLGLIGFGTDCFILGSAGKKPADQLSGDLDIGIDLLNDTLSHLLNDIFNLFISKLCHSNHAFFRTVLRTTFLAALRAGLTATGFSIGNSSVALGTKPKRSRIHVKIKFIVRPINIQH